MKIAGISTPNFSSLDQALHFHITTVRDTPADLIVFPELSLCASSLHCLEAVEEAALVPSHPAIHALRTHCKASQKAACFGFLMRESSRIYNTALTILPDDTIHVYRKVHRIGAFPDLVISAGSSFSVLQSPWGKIGTLICYDLDFPEAFRALALQGCDLVLVPSAWPREGNLWRALIQVRALENHFYVVAVNQGGSSYPDPSMAADPFGKVLACAHRGLLRFECDPREKRGPIVERNGALKADFLRDRVPHAYGALTKI